MNISNSGSKIRNIFTLLEHRHVSM